MGPMVVIVGEPAPEARPQFAAGLEGGEIHALVLHGSPQPFNEDVIHPAAWPIHADRHLCCPQHAGKGMAGKLAALIGVEDLDPRA